MGNQILAANCDVLRVRRHGEQCLHSRTAGGGRAGDDLIDESAVLRHDQRLMLPRPRGRLGRAQRLAGFPAVQKAHGEGSAGVGEREDLACGKCLLAAVRNEDHRLIGWQLARFKDGGRTRRQ